MASMSFASQACWKSLTISACRTHGSLRRADATAGCGGQLSAGRRGTADDAGHLGEGVAEDVVEDERDALGRGHRVEHDEEGHADRLIQGDPVGRVHGGTARPPGGPLRTFGQRLGDPFAHVGLSPDPGRAEQVEADAAGDRRQPGAGGCDGVLMLPGHGVPADIGLLNGILHLGHGAEKPVGEIDQLTPLAHDRVQARAGPGASWLCRGAHGADRLPRSHLPHHIRQDSAAKREVGASPHTPAGCLVVLVTRAHHPAGRKLRRHYDPLLRPPIALGRHRPLVMTRHREPARRHHDYLGSGSTVH
jgi:hypothetical protein